jgi:hypothetical protein
MTYDIDEHDPDWSKRLSLHHPLNTEEGFRRWMRESGKTGSEFAGWRSIRSGTVSATRGCSAS